MRKCLTNFSVGRQRTLVEFLVTIEIDHASIPAEERPRILEAEMTRGRELRAAGTLLRIWRLPGRRANVSLYSAADADALHEALTSLPLWPWMSIRVEALATHPLERATAARPKSEER